MASFIGYEFPKAQGAVEDGVVPTQSGGIPLVLQKATAQPVDLLDRVVASMAIHPSKVHVPVLQAPAQSGAQSRSLDVPRGRGPRVSSPLLAKRTANSDPAYMPVSRNSRDSAVSPYKLLKVEQPIIACLKEVSGQSQPSFSTSAASPGGLNAPMGLQTGTQRQLPPPDLLTQIGGVPTISLAEQDQ